LSEDELKEKSVLSVPLMGSNEPADKDLITALSSDELTVEEVPSLSSVVIVLEVMLVASLFPKSKGGTTGIVRGIVVFTKSGLPHSVIVADSLPMSSSPSMFENLDLGCVLTDEVGVPNAVDKAGLRTSVNGVGTSSVVLVDRFVVPTSVDRLVVPTSVVRLGVPPSVDKVGLRTFVDGVGTSSAVLVDRFVVPTSVDRLGVPSWVDKAGLRTS
jgi:hypothetical protein